MFKNLKEHLIAFLLSLLLFFIGSLLILSNSHNWENQINIFSNKVADNQSKILSENILKSISAAKILAAHTISLKGYSEKFKPFAHELINSLDGITNLQLAPDGIVTYIYPLTGHEKALGHNIIEADARKKEAILAKMSKKLTLAGPFELIQGGTAIIGRQPVFIEGKFWGFASVLIYLDNLLKTTGLDELKDKNFSYKLYRSHPDNGKKEVFAGEKASFDENRVFTRRIDIANATWYIDIIYMGQIFSYKYIIAFYLINLIISILIGFWIYDILTRPKELNKEVEKKTKELLKEKLELKKLSSAVEYNGNAIVICNSEGYIEYVNPSFSEITGFSRNEIIGKKHKLLKDKKIKAVIEKGNRYTGEYKSHRKNKKVFYSFITISSIKDKNAKIVNYVTIAEDITKKVQSDKLLKEKELLLSHQAKQASIGEMLENIAHQWRQPLSAISSAASGLKMQSELDILNDITLHEFADGILRNAKHLSTTIDDFRDFFKRDKEEEIFTIIDVFDKSLTLLKSKLSNRGIKVVKDDLNFKFYGLKNEFVQVVINILNNSIDALENIDENKRVILIDLKENQNNIILSIRDSGNGIPKKIINKVCDAYFSTKQGSKGTGIGLYMSKKIIEEHMNGKLTVSNERFDYENEEFFGAKIEITLPYFT